MNKTTSIRFTYNGDECVALFDESRGRRGIMIEIEVNSSKYHSDNNFYNEDAICFKFNTLPKSYIDIAYAHYRNQPTETQVQEPERLTDNLKQGGI